MTAYAPSRPLAFETAAEHVSRDVPVARPDATISDVRRSLENRRFETATDVAICEEGRLVGVLSIERLLAGPGDALARDLMDPDPPVVAPGVDQEIAAWKAVERGESSLAVVDEAGAFVGFIPPQRLLMVLLQEHQEDLARLGGFMQDTSAARTATLEPVERRFWHRIPWLLVGFIGALLSAEIVGSFEEQLRRNVTLAFFVPGVVYLADAVGTQTEALVIRGLSVGVPIGAVIRREVATGLLVGLALGLTFLPFGLLRWGEGDVALAVSVALLAACSVATIVAMALPWAFQRLGTDPAFGSGPLATVVQDLLSILIYFGVALVLVD
ncbi:MAG TPA: magnesium transporter [Dehalococcoidia bacterium]|nr:magnesium transporter [Dehalococcoidia bacterium]